MTYAHEYNLDGGKKSMQAFSRPFSLARYAPERWLIAPEDLDWLMDRLDRSPHVPVAPKHALQQTAAYDPGRIEIARRDRMAGAARAPGRTDEISV